MLDLLNTHPVATQLVVKHQNIPSSKCIVCMYVYMYVCMYDCMYVYMYVRMYVCMYVCMYVYVL